VTPQDYSRYDVFVNGELSDVQARSGAGSISYGNLGESNTAEVIAVDAMLVNQEHTSPQKPLSNSRSA
jgi:hypothetical protein